MTSRLSTRASITLLLSLVLLFPSVLVGCKKQEVAPPAPPPVKEVVEPVEPAKPIVWPLTGSPADAEAITRRPLSVKIENSAAARPQTGLQSADVVYESIAEGGITRFNAIFHSVLPAEVGPVRSARLGDAKIVPQYGALFVFSGSSAAVRSAVRANGLDDLSQDAGVTGPYRRSSNRSAPHNLYADPAAFYPVAESRDMAVVYEPKPLAFELDGASLDTTVTASSVNVPFSSYNVVDWNYDAAASSYKRVNSGVVFNDTATGEQVHAKNVVIIFTDYIPGPITKGSTTYDLALDTEGRVAIFSNGLHIEGKWKGSADQPPVFTDEAGKPILLAPGNTWFQVVSNDTVVTTTP